jgi:hypothetical protein
MWLQAITADLFKFALMARLCHAHIVLMEPISRQI